MASVTSSERNGIEKYGNALSIQVSGHAEVAPELCGQKVCVCRHILLSLPGLPAIIGGSSLKMFGWDSSSFLFDSLLKEASV